MNKNTWLIIGGVAVLGFAWWFLNPTNPALGNLIGTGV
jgi:hypothetical protein